MNSLVFRSFIFMCMFISLSEAILGDFSIQKMDPLDVEAGDHIAIAHVSKTHRHLDPKITFFQDAIFLNWLDGVIYFEQGTNSTIRQIPLSEFVSEGVLMLITWDHMAIKLIGGRKKTQEQVTTMAKYLKNYPEEWDNYVMDHFAEYCKIGIATTMDGKKAAENLLKLCTEVIDVSDIPIGGTIKYDPAKTRYVCEYQKWYFVKRIKYVSKDKAAKVNK